MSSIHFKNQFKKLKKTHFYIILMREKKTERDAYIRTHLHAGLWRLKAFEYECMCVCDKCVLDEGIKFINHFIIFISYIHI